LFLWNNEYLASLIEENQADKDMFLFPGSDKDVFFVCFLVGSRTGVVSMEQ